MSERVGIIGLGLVGEALAERLLGAGLAVTGFDIRSEQTARLQALGGQPACCAASVAETCDRLFLSLPTSAVVADVLEEIGPNLRPHALIIDTTTGSPEDSIRFGESLAAAGADYVDATVGGSSRQVRNAEAILICGASEAAFARSADLLRHIAGQCFHVGPVGSGARMKLVMNLVLGLNRAVLAEGLSYARAVGLDPSLALDILRAGPAYSRAMDVKGPRMLAEEFEPEARLSQHLKDVRLILASGVQSGASLPLSSVHAALLETAERRGYGARDNSAIIKAFGNEPE